MRWIIRPAHPLCDRSVRSEPVVVRVPGDKSIGHRAVMLSALADGTSRVTGLSGGLDNRSTVGIFRALGVRIDDVPDRPDALVVHGAGLRGLGAPTADLDCGNSGTTMRLMSGVLAGQPFESRLVGDESLSRRPMKRVIEPLTAMGARLTAEGADGRPPLRVHGGGLHGIEWTSAVASAQVKSAILLAGLRAEGTTIVREPALSRDHTERMLSERGVAVHVDGRTVRIEPTDGIAACDVEVPGDPSSAAFPLAIAVLGLEAGVRIEGVGLNPTRTGFFDALIRMGARLDVRQDGQSGGEPHGAVTARRSLLKATVIEGDLVPLLIDEVPILAVLAARAVGETTIRDAAELRVKESDRIAVVAEQLRRMGVTIDELPDGLVVQGGRRLFGARLHSRGDHRIAMAMAVAALFAEGESVIDDVGCVDTSFPGFVDILRALAPRATVLVETRDEG